MDTLTPKRPIPSKKKLEELSARPSLKTYSHLSHLPEKPDDYAIATTNLLYYPGRGFEVRTPIGDWYAEHQFRPGLDPKRDWNLFSDPARLTYFTYIRSHHDSEIHIGELFQAIENLEVAPPTALAALVSGGRFFYHGLQMAAAFCGKMAPTSQILNCFLFQSANEMRKSQHFAYRLGLFRKRDYHAEIYNSDLWENDPAWQPLRKLTEELLVLTDWIEVFAALNTAIKPIVDQLFLFQMAAFARSHQEALFAEVLSALQADFEWERDWSSRFCDFLEGDQGLIQSGTEKWKPLAIHAAQALIEKYDLPILEGTQR